VRQLDGGAERAGARFRALFRARARTVPPLAATAAAQTPDPDRPLCHFNREARRYAVCFRIPQAAPERRSRAGSRSEKFSRTLLLPLLLFLPSCLQPENPQ
jgi:hypothetical protein